MSPGKGLGVPSTSPCVQPREGGCNPELAPAEGSVGWEGSGRAGGTWGATSRGHSPARAALPMS